MILSRNNGVAALVKEIRKNKIQPIHKSPQIPVQTICNIFLKNYLLIT
jgi:hypothetical protein